MSEQSEPDAVPMDAAPRSDDALVESRVPIGIAVACPGCGAKVHSNTAEPGAKIRCLNCGTRFVPLQASGNSTTEAALQKPIDEAQEFKPKVREPKAAGYWFLRIPAMLYFAGASLGFAIFCVSSVIFLFGSFQSGNWLQSFFIGVAYLPLLPLSGFYLFAVTRSLERTESHTLKAAWNTKLMQSAVPAAKGSSLPYILPFAVGPVVTFIVQAMDSAQGMRYTSLDQLLFLGALSIGCFFFGFMVDDLRQFTWRQRAIASTLAPTPGNESTPGNLKSFPLTAILSVLTIVAFIGMSVAILVQESSWRGRNFYQYKTQSFLIATALSWTVPFFLTGRNIVLAIQAWRQTVVLTSGGPEKIEREEELIDLPYFRMSAALLIFAVTGIITILSAIYDRRPMNFGYFDLPVGGICALLTIAWSILLIVFVGRSKQVPFKRCAQFVLAVIAIASSIIPFLFRDGNYREFTETVTLTMAFCGGILLCALLAEFYRDLRFWRKAQTLFWKGRDLLKNAPSLPIFVNAVFIFTYALLGFEILVMGITMGREFFLRPGTGRAAPWEAYLALPLFSFLLHFPTLWVVLVAREFLLVEATAASARTVTDAQARAALEAHS